MAMRPATPEAVSAALGAVDAWVPDLAPDERYVDLATLIAGGLAGRVAGRLGGAPDRVGHSALLMGVTSRLWALTVVPYVTSRVVADPAHVVARDDDGVLTLGVRGMAGVRCESTDDLAEIVLGLLRPIVAASPLTQRVLWGNTAASLYAVPRVNHLPEAVPVVADLLARAPLAGEVDLASVPPGRRRTCCLFYLVDGAGLCGDCVLDQVPTSRASW